MQIVIDISEKDLELFQKTSFVYDEKLLFKQSAEDIKQTNALFRLMDAIKDAKPAQKEVYSTEAFWKTINDAVDKLEEGDAE